jgi:hypothetical protein
MSPAHAPAAALTGADLHAVGTDFRLRQRREFGGGDDLLAHRAERPAALWTCRLGHEDLQWRRAEALLRWRATIAEGASTRFASGRFGIGLGLAFRVRGGLTMHIPLEPFDLGAQLRILFAERGVVGEQSADQRNQLGVG